MLSVTLYYDTFVNGHKDDMGFVDDAVKRLLQLLGQRWLLSF